jgi:hypothetical protein
MEKELAIALTERAVSALQTSTTMLEVAQNLLDQGNSREAARLRNEARYKRNESILLMDQARAAGDTRTAGDNRSNVLPFGKKQTPAERAEAEVSFADAEVLLKTGKVRHTRAR